MYPDYKVFITLVVVCIGLILSNVYSIFYKEKQKYEQGMTDMHSMCYDLGEAIIQSKVTNKIIKCEALTVAPSLHQ